MEGIALGAAVMGGLGLLFGAILALAHRLLRVEEDPRLDELEGMLPGTNCGACGEPGCRAFAEKLLANAKPPGACTVSGPERVDAVADFLGVAAGSVDRLVARLHCAGGTGRAAQMAAYEGYPSCRAATLVGGGGKGCAWGCLGLADCEVACTFDAIYMNADGLPVVRVDKCTACGDCVVACPRALFELLPVRQPLLVQCRIPLAGDEAKALCAVACDACGRCAQDAPSGLIRMVDNLPVIDYQALVPPDPRATFRCPTGAIRLVAGEQFPGSVPRNARTQDHAFVD